MKKLISIFACVCVLLSAMVITASAAETSATISFADKSNRTEYDASHQIWAQNGITVTNNKAASTSNVGDYNGRFYKSSETIIEYPNMTKIVIDTSGIEAKYRAWDTSFTDSNATASATDSATTITFATPVNSFKFASMSAQCRANSITVYAEAAGGNEPACTHTATSTEANGNETHKVVCNDCGETVTASVDCTDADVNGKCDVCGGDVAIPTPDPTPDSTLTIVEAIALGETKEHNTYTTGKYYVTGVIESVYNTQYGNMYIVDENGNRLTVYGTYDATGENGYADMANAPVAGDTVKLYGKIGYYSSSAQMKNAWIIEVTPGEGEEPENNDPAADSVLTIEQALALGATKTHNTYTENKYYVTGVITEIYNEMYGNMKITDDAGNILTVYGTYDETGETRFDAMETKPAVGDTVTVYGIIGQYNGTAQMKNGWFKAAPVVDDDNDNDSDNAGGSTDGTTGGDTTGGATTGSTSGSTTGTNNNNTNADTSTTSPATGDSMGAVAMMAIAAAAVLVASKKR